MFDYESVYGLTEGAKVDGVALKAGDSIFVTNQLIEDFALPEFEVGDVVGLIVGGPNMVVLSVCEHGCVEVAWADSDGDVVIDVFPEEALVNHE